MAWKIKIGSFPETVIEENRTPKAGEDLVASEYDAVGRYRRMHGIETIGADDVTNIVHVPKTTITEHEASPVNPKPAGVMSSEEQLNPAGLRRGAKSRRKGGVVSSKDKLPKKE